MNHFWIMHDAKCARRKREWFRITPSVLCSTGQVSMNLVDSRWFDCLEWEWIIAVPPPVCFTCWNQISTESHTSLRTGHNTRPTHVLVPVLLLVFVLASGQFPKIRSLLLCNQALLLWLQSLMASQRIFPLSQSLQPILDSPRKSICPSTSLWSLLPNPKRGALLSVFNIHTSCTCRATKED